MNSFSGEPRFYSGSEFRDHLRSLVEDSTKIEIATAWISKSNALELLLSQGTNVTVRMVVGVGGFNTDPVVLKKLGNHPSIVLKIYGNAKPPLFHPKLYLFQRAHFRRVLIGSMNLTNAGTLHNIESMFSTEDKHKQADKEFERFWGSPDAIPINQFDLAAYEAERRKILTAVKYADATAVLDDDVVKSSDSQLEIDSLKEGWKSFVSELKKAPNGLEGYKRVLHVGRRFIDRDWSQDFSKDEFAIMFGLEPYSAFGYLGVLSQNQKKFQTKKYLSVRYQIRDALKEALKLRHLEVPLVQKVVERLLEVPYCGAALATRLLVLARPDFFVVVNGKSFEGLSKRFDLFVSDREFNAPDYIKLLQKIHATEWYQSPEPGDHLEREIWQARAALIDALVMKTN